MTSTIARKGKKLGWAHISYGLPNYQSVAVDRPHQNTVMFGIRLLTCASFQTWSRLSAKVVRCRLEFCPIGSRDWYVLGRHLECVAPAGLGGSKPFWHEMGGRRGLSSSPVQILIGQPESTHILRRLHKEFSRINNNDSIDMWGY